MIAHPISETRRNDMPRLDVLADTEKRLRSEVFAPLHANLIRMLTRYASNGVIPLSQTDHVENSASAIVYQAFLGKPDQSGAIKPYRVTRGEVIPRSPYFAALWALMIRAAQTAVSYHAAMMREKLPDDLIRAYGMATLSPFEEQVNEADEETPLYDPLHLWIGPDGKQLSDRIWNVAGDMARKLNAYLTDAIARRKSVEQIARELELYLLPERALKRTEMPFGDFAYEAMRLVRTEVAYAHNRADALAAQNNPFVEGYTFFTAPTHECCDECDQVEAGSPYPKSDLSHLPPRHPHCMCGVAWIEVKDTAAVIARLRDNVKSAVSRATKAITDFISPIHRQFVNLLFRGRK